MIIGMDFGTTNSGMAAYDGQQLQLIPISRSGTAIDRTALYITNDRQIYTGRSAIDTYFAQNLNRPVNIQRVRVGEITMTFSELPSFVKDVYIDKDMLSPGRLFLSFKTALSSFNYVGTVVGSHFYFLEDIIALYLLIAKQQAEKYLKTEIKQIVLGRPVRFNFDAQADQLAKERLLKAAFRAGYEEVYLQYEPIAAAYHYESTIDHEQNILVFDFGGGTLDISILRVGNTENRAVLATGGVPIAGDVFDQKLVRAKLPKHFGEGTNYFAGNTLLPVPSSYYEAFSNWQEMLTLQRPDVLEEIKKIERHAEKPQQIRALRQLVSSSYGIKMFDIVEGSKRELSNSTHTIIKIDGQDFRVREIVTRAEFERVIRSEIRTIETYLDGLIEQAGLKPNHIDVVIRTGGSSQIPAFVNMLEARFGKEKVRSLDVFSSVTSGLGIIAHQIEQGKIDMPVHRPSDFISSDHITGNTKKGIPVVDFEVMKKFIALTETDAEDQQTIALVGLTPTQEVVATLEPLSEWNAQHLESLIAAPSNKPLLLLTSEYRFLLKTPRLLTRFNSLGFDLADAEGFQIDIFGYEYVRNITV
ncbi:MAG: Hsp70 family protein, partial [Chitinophagaceae bacterium]|nr:Hsp70 family protein [Anaerolineae bacterium]